VQGFLSDLDELEGCVMTSIKPKRPRKGVFKATKKTVKVGTTKNK